MPDALLEKRPDGVALITLNRPEVLNSLGGNSVTLAARYLKECAEDGNVRCVAMTGQGRGFCSGGDIDGMARGASRNGDQGALNPIESATAGLMSLHETLIEPLATMAKPTVALVNGPAAGGGLGLALAFDVRIASDRARFVPAFKDIGQSGDCGVSYMLPRLMGLARAKEHMFFNIPFDAQQALDYGVVNRVMPHDKLLTDGLAYCAALAQGPTAVYGRMKQNQNFGVTHTYRETLELEAHNCTMCQHGEDNKIAVQAFVTGKPPQWTGR